MLTAGSSRLVCGAERASERRRLRGMGRLIKAGPSDERALSRRKVRYRKSSGSRWQRGGGRLLIGPGEASCV